jgi:hypothetical protein
MWQPTTRTTFGRLALVESAASAVPAACPDLVDRPVLRAVWVVSVADRELDHRGSADLAERAASSDPEEPRSPYNRKTLLCASGPPSTSIENAKQVPCQQAQPFIRIS